MNTCPCTRPIHDQAVICGTCGHDLENAIAEVAELRGLAYDLDIAVTRQARLGAKNGGRATETPIVFDNRASEAFRQLSSVLRSWTRLVVEETGAGTVPTFGPAHRSCRHHSCREIRTRGLPGESLGDMASWLKLRVAWLRHHEAGADAYREILDAVRDARRVVDRPGERIYCGPCSCDEDLYARAGAVEVACRNPECGLVWGVADRRAYLLDAARDVEATAADICRALTRLGAEVTPATIRGYERRKRLKPVGEREEGGRPVKLWRTGDVLEILNPTAEKVSA